MARIKYIQHNFTNGEISEGAEGRVDFSKYYHSVKTMQNFLPTILGGVTRRPGFHFVDYAKRQDEKCRLIPFKYGVTQAYVIEASSYYFRFLKDGYLIREETGDELVTNGGFADWAGWTNYDEAPGETIIAAGQAKLSPHDTGIASLGQAITTVAGKTYQLRFQLYNSPYNKVRVRIGTSPEGSEIIPDVCYNGAEGEKAVCFIARGDTTYIQFLRWQEVGEPEEGDDPDDVELQLEGVHCYRYDPIEISTPYGEDDLPSLRWAQDAEDLYIVHPWLAPRILTRSSDTAWTLETMEFEDGPYFNEVVNPKITPSWAGPTVDKVTNGDFHVDSGWTKGGNWTISDGTANKSAGGVNNLSQDITVTVGYIYKITYTIKNISGGMLRCKVGGVSGTWRDAPGIYSEIFVATTTGDLIFEPDGADVVCSIDNVWAGRLSILTAAYGLFDSGHVGACWRIKQTETWGWCRIEQVNSSTSAYAYVGTAIGSDASEGHREGRWSTFRGWPRDVTFHENRLAFGGAATSPQTFWESQTEIFNGMTPGTNDADAVQFTLGSNDVNLIQWIISARNLIIGTAGGEFRASGDNAPITPTNIDVKNDTTYGCADIKPLKIGSAVIFVQTAGKQLLELLYNYDSDSYEAKDLTVLVEHLTEIGIEDIVYQKGYLPVIWAYNEEGTLLALTYNRGQEISSWSHHISGIVESLAVIPNPSEREDEVYAVIVRTLNDVETRCIEYLDPYLNVDCGLSGTFSNPVTIVGGLEHLIGEVVDIVGNDAVYPSQIVDTNGQITLDVPASTLEVGLGYTSYLETLRPEIKSEQETIQASRKRWTRIYVRLVDTTGLKINGEEIPFRTSFDPMGSGITPFTGDKKIINIGWEDDGRIIVEQEKPLSATILCIFGNLEINED